MKVGRFTCDSPVGCCGAANEARTDYMNNTPRAPFVSYNLCVHGRRVRRDIRGTDTKSCTHRTDTSYEEKLYEANL